MPDVDRRDEPTWVVVELTRTGEQLAEEGTLEGALRDALGVAHDHPVFVPSCVYTRGGRRTAVHLMEGYAFIGSGLPETAYFALEHSSQYVRQVLSAGGDEDGFRTLQTLPDANVSEMRQQLREHVSTDLDVGMAVMITEGTYAAIHAEVLGFEEDEAVVCINELRSLQIITRIPRVFLDPLGDDDLLGIINDTDY